jgi:flagellar biosynthesis protein FliR
MLDTNTLEFLTGKFLIGILLFIRVMGLFVAAPFFKNTAMLPQVKIYLGIIIAVSMTTAFWREQPTIDLHLWNLILLVLKEFVVGLAIGFAADIVFQAATFAGGLIDFDMGYQTAMLFDPSSTNPTLIGDLLNMAVLMLFLFLNGHHFLIESLYASVRAVPLTYFEITESTISLLTRLAGTVMILGIKIAAPALIALFLTNLSLALLGRVAPQTNIFIMSFQLKVVVGLLVLLSSVPLFIWVSKNALIALESETMKMILSLNPGRV